MLFVDTETTLNEWFVHLLPEVKPPANYKNPDTIEKWLVENGTTARQEQLGKMALDPLLFRFRALAWANGLDDEPEVIVINDENEEGQALRQFWSHVARLSEQRQLFPVVGYYIQGFDLPRLLWRSMMLKVTPTVQFDLGRYSSDILDLCLTLKNYNPHVHSIVGMGMKSVCDLLGIPNDLPDTDGSMVGNMSDKEVECYAGNDIVLLRRLYQRMAYVYFMPPDGVFSPDLCSKVWTVEVAS